MSVNAYDCEVADASDMQIRRARKEHRCAACRRTIRVGDRYIYHSWVVRGEGFSAVKRCARCQFIFRTLVKLHAEESIGSWSPTFVAPALDCGDSFFDTFDREPPLELQRVAFMTDDEAQALPLG